MFRLKSFALQVKQSSLVWNELLNLSFEQKQLLINYKFLNRFTNNVG